jgi:hypothetical protein
MTLEKSKPSKLEMGQAASAAAGTTAATAAERRIFFEGACNAW